MSRYSSVLLTALLTVGLVLTGCDSSGSAGESGALELRMSGSTTTQTATRTATTKMTAADVDTAYVTITEVSIVPAEDTTEGDSTEVGVRVLSDSNFTVDLKDLQAGIDTALADIDIPTGTYGQLRLVTANEAQVSFTDTDGTESVMIASGPQTGLKVNFDPFTIEGADDRAEITVNWDVEESLQGAPQGQYVITPAINDAAVNVISAGN